MTFDDMRHKLRMMFAGGGLNSAIDALAHRIDRNLMLFGNRVYDLQSGESVELPESDNGAHIHENAVADAVASLLGADADHHCIQLLLPCSEFLAQPVSLPGLSAGDMKSALKLQVATRLPEQDHDLALCLTHNPFAGHPAEAIVWWLPTLRADRLFAALEAKSIYLAAIMPRSAWLAHAIAGKNKARIPVLVDQDEHMQTVLGQVAEPASTDGETLRLNCLQTAVADLADAETAKSWQTELAQWGLETAEISFTQAQDYLRFARAHDLPVLDANISCHAIYPQGALDARHKLDRGQRRTMILKVAAGIAGLLMLPVLYQSWQLSSLGSELEQLHQSSSEPRSNQSAVRDFETQWGVFTEFPEQNVIDVMLALQQMINPGVLSTFSIDEGMISIEGESEDPQNVLELLEQHPMFTEVDFARATNNNRYFIDLRLATVNFPAYQEWHFPGQRQ